MGPDSRLRAASVIVPVLAACILLVSTAGPLGALGSAQDQARGPEDIKLVTVDSEGQNQLWPYTSRRQRFETLTLPINVIVHGNDTRVRWFLMTGRNVNWNDSEGEWQGVGGEEAGELSDGSTWYPAHGATRYTYIYSPRNPYGGWVDEAYQLHDGDYFGTRYHIRAYTGGRMNTSWTAIQAHHDYWDWFRLRHTVGSTATARQYVEQSFYGSPAVERIARERYANGGILDADGWVTVITLQKPTPPDPEGTETGTGSGLGPGAGPGRGTQHTAGSIPSPLTWGLSLSAVLLAGTVASFGVTEIRDRLVDVRRSESLVALVAAALLTMPSLRWVSIAAERSLPWLSPKIVAGLGYFIVAVALPVVVVVLARETRADRAAPLAALGLGVGILLDYTLVGLTAVPVSVMLHRLTVVLAIGLLAAAGARLDTDRPGHAWLPVVATLAWIGVLVWPLFDLL